MCRFACDRKMVRADIYPESFILREVALLIEIKDLFSHLGVHFSST